MVIHFGLLIITNLVEVRLSLCQWEVYIINGYLDTIVVNVSHANNLLHPTYDTGM